MPISYAPSPETSYLFIDGNYLQECARRVCHDWFDCEPDIDFQSWGAGFTKVFFYDSLPAQKSNESPEAFQARLSAKTALFERLRSLDGWHVQEGVSRWRKNAASQKEVDILIAVDMLTHTHRKNMSRLTFIAGDQDFRPLLEAVVRDGMYVTLWHGSKQTSADLKHTADSAVELGLYEIHARMTPGFRIGRPLPHRTQSAIDHSPQNGILKELGFRNGNLMARLWQSAIDPNWMIHGAHPLPTMHQQMSHQHDPAFLKRVYEELFGTLEWKPNP